MKVVIAEKPSVAREIAALLGATKKKDGFLAGTGYCVTWAFGHLVALAMPEDYGIKGFQRGALPIIPDPFTLTVRKVRKDNGYVADAGASKQLETIERLIEKCEGIIVATDAGREGELIFRYIYEYLKCDKPFERLWISSLTEKAIKQGFDTLKPGSDFDALYHAAEGRSRADWLVGINASQALSIVADNGVYSLGRVQTPTLALICKRYLENKSFAFQTYWQIKLEHRREFVDFHSVSKTKWDDKKQAEKILGAIQRNGIARVVSVESKKVNEQPPLLFDLTGLQKEANKKLGLSAGQTLQIAQGLYEKKFITYPRTGSKHIPGDLWEGIPVLVRALEKNEAFREAIDHVKWHRFNKRIVNDLKVTDHHGLLITEKIPSALSPKERAIHGMVAFRLLESISHPCNKLVTDVTLQAMQHDFGLRGCKILEPGWRSIQGSFADEDSDPIQDLPELKADDELKIKKATVLEKKTKPPALYTEAGLLAAMEGAGKQVGREEERKALQGIGIGTPSTRAGIIETLFQRDYIKREKKSLVPTEKGLQVYGLVRDKKIADVSMTAEWEMALQRIENGEADPATFTKEIEGYAVSITNELLQASITGGDVPKLVCPKCKRERLAIRDKIVKCPDEGCGWLQFRKVCGVQISIADVERLVTTGKTALVKGMKAKSGKKFDAYIVMDDKGKTAFEFGKATHKKK